MTIVVGLSCCLCIPAVESGAGGEKSHVYGVGEVATAKEGEVAEGGHGCRNAENEGEFECGRG